MDPTLESRWRRLTQEQQRLHIAITRTSVALGGQAFLLVLNLSSPTVISWPGGEESFSPVSLGLNLERLRNAGLIEHSEQNHAFLVQPTQDGIELADAMPGPEEAQPVIGEKVGTDAASTERAKVRSAWLDQMLAGNLEWTSDTDLAANGGPSYNTIQRYRSGARSTRDPYVRRKLSRAFRCEITAVPE